MGKKLCLSLFALAVLALAGCRDVPEQESLGKVVVYPADALDSEKAAAGELKTYLDKITGEDHALVSEDKARADAPAIYVGRTAFAQRAGLDFSTFAEGEYAVKSVGKNLVIGGSAWNGVMHLLTRELGCRFLTWDCEVVPRQGDLALPPLDIRRKPTFAGRTIYIPPWGFGFTPESTKKYGLWMSHNFGNAYNNPYERQSKTGDATGCHNAFFWIDPREYASSHPEYFTNKKFNSPLWPRNQDGQVCWSNRQVWDITLRKLREVIKKDRTELPKEKWPTTYQLSQNDIHNYCECPACKAAGNLADAQLRYVNHVAEAIAKEWPDVKVMAFAYVGTEDAPKNLKPAANVVIQWCDLYTRHDLYRPLSHKFNAGQKAKIDAWRELGAKLVVWEYWNMGIEGVYFDPPRIEVMVDSIAPDLRYFAASGVQAMMVEDEFCQKNPQNFYDLQCYLGFQLMADVSRDEESLINDYMDGCYGPAAPAMKEFLALLRQAVKDEKEPLFYISNPKRDYIDGAFLEKAYRLLKKAQAAIPPDSAYYRRVQQEMISPLAVIILNPQHDFLKRTGLAKADILAEYRAARLSRIEQPWVTAERQKQDKAALEQDLAAMALEIPTPDFLKSRGKLLKFAWPQMGDSYEGSCKMESDPDSALGKALVARAPFEAAKHDLSKPFAGGYYPNSFGVYSRSDKRSSETIRTAVPQDEKYHWYKIPAFDYGPDSFLWGFYWLSSVNLSTVFTNADGLPGYNVWETWVSVKYAGPAYVKGSKQKNGVFIDQVILVKPETAKP